MNSIEPLQVDVSSRGAHGFLGSGSALSQVRSERDEALAEITRLGVVTEVRGTRILVEPDGEVPVRGRDLIYSLSIQDSK